MYWPTETLMSRSSKSDWTKRVVFRGHWAKEGGQNCKKTLESFHGAASSAAGRLRQNVHRIAPAAARTISAATRFLGTRFIDLQCAAFHIQAIEFADGFGRVVSGSEFYKTETARAPGFAVGNDASRGYLISLRGEKLLQSFVRHAKREIPNIEFCHTRFLFLSLSLFLSPKEKIRFICCLASPQKALLASSQSVKNPT